MFELFDMDEKQKFAERFTVALGLAGLSNKKQKELGSILGVSATMISNYKNGIKVPATDTAITIAGVLGVRFEWLMTGRGSPDIFKKTEKKLGEMDSNAVFSGAVNSSDEVEVAFFMDVELPKKVTWELGANDTPARFNIGRSILASKNVKPENAVCVKIFGNSMQPRFFDGDVAGVDMGCKDVIDGKFYAINHDGMLRVKRLYRLPGGGLRVNSLNQSEHPDEIYSAKDRHSIYIIGQLFWLSSLSL